MKDKLFRFAFRLLQNIQEAEDAVQDVMAGVWAKRAEWPQWHSIEAYCMTATRNNCLDRLRRRKVATVQEGWAGTVSSADQDPYEKITNKEMIQRIRRCMDALPQQQQQVLRLREMEGFSYNEIAEVLDMSLPQVKINLFRGRNAIKQTITKQEERWKKQP
ncbi:RNA polymerase sigma factor [Puia dinghuensis]|uniref:DNA-directed RNA polymerase sigma-70 factor n=1 Tax=Puia dinghuensis TaxID=1792502 RepID=A0A8J2UD02_9BACT|nr:RNA polymerase sigma factor [Puia dinghuensis]GGA98942.1 DNA-directed RNA polymerase sigma-70 factor [Puia dinghuensis]